MNDQETKTAQVAEDADSIESLFGADTTLEQDGVWFEYGSMRFKLARAGGGNTAYSKTLTMLTKPLRRAIEVGSLKEEKAREVQASLMAKSVVKSWERVRVGGQELPFSEQACYKLLMDYPDLMNELNNQAQRLEFYRRDARENASKN